MKPNFAILLAAAAAFFTTGCATRFDDGSYRTVGELPRIEALAEEINGSMVFGQVLVPSSQFGGKRPCVILCHGFAGFTRWDDVAHDLCRAGIAVIIPHHRGAWGSEGEYTVSGCIEDAAELAAMAIQEGEKRYGIDPSAVWLVGHSMGGNSVLNAAAGLPPAVRGVALIAPCDIGYIMENTDKDGMGKFLVGEGLHALRRKSDEAVVNDIAENAAKMRFVSSAKALSGRSVFLATGEYDTVVPSAPLDEFWNALPDDVRRLRKTYPASHSFMGCRRELAKDLAEFILD